MRRKTLLNSAVTLFLLKKQHWYNFWGCHLGCKLALQIPSEKPLTGHAYPGLGGAVNIVEEVLDDKLDNYILSH